MKDTAEFRRVAEREMRFAGCCTIRCLYLLHSNTGQGTNSGGKNGGVFVSLKS